MTFGLLVLCASGAALLAVQSHRLSAVLRVPTPAFFLVAAALAVELIPDLTEPRHQTVERVVTVALLVILFDGGLHSGARRARAAAPAILSLGVLGTFATVAGAALAVHFVVDVSWYASVLVATAIAPTDPAVVFSVLGQREIEGRSGTVLEGVRCERPCGYRPYGGPAQRGFPVRRGARRGPGDVPAADGGGRSRRGGGRSGCCSVSRPSLTGPASSPCSSRASCSVMSARLTSERSKGSTRRGVLLLLDEQQEPGPVLALFARQEP